MKDTPGRPIPDLFVGLSFEKNELLTGAFDPENRELVRLFSHLGPGTLLPSRISETNTSALAGEYGVSDVFASAPWYLEWSFRFAELVATGIDLQCDLDAARDVYTPLEANRRNCHIRPIYHGMLSFRHASAGRLLPVEIHSGDDAGGLVAYAMRGPGARLALLLIHQVGGQSARVRLDLPHAIAGERGRLLRLEAPRLEARHGITLGGSRMRAGGTWNGPAWETVRRSRGNWLVDLPPASATLLEMRTAR